MRKLIHSISKIPTPIVLLFMCILAYGLLIPWQGFYLDDWYILLYQKLFGANNFAPFFNQDRPLFGYVYQVFVPIFRESRIGWQIFAVFAHALAASCFWWLLVLLMPNRQRITTMAALFFAVYPGFQFHWFAIMYSQVFTLLAIYFLSFILMIGAAKAAKRKWLFILGALVCQIIGIVPQETFLGLEFIRPFILWLLLWQQDHKIGRSCKQAFLCWIPYLIVLLGFVSFRLGNSSAYYYQANILTDLAASPVSTIVKLIGEFFWGLVDSIFTTWITLVNLLKRDLLSSVSIIMLLVMAIGFLIAAIVMSGKKQTQNPSGLLLVIAFGLASTLFSMLPFLAGGFKISLDFPNNRYLIALAPGASLVAATLLECLLRTNTQRWLLGALMVGFAVGAHLITGRSYKLIWQAQQDIFWQLSWRAPGLQENTTLLTDDLPISKYYSGPSLTAPLNIIYGAQPGQHQIPYLFVLITQQGDLLPDLEAGNAFYYSFRSFTFEGNSSSLLLIKKPSDGCLRVMSPSDSDYEFINNNRHSFWHNAIPLSNLDLIIADPEDPAVLPAKFFGQENRNQWCYYFEKADLARQQQQWTETVNYFEEAQAAGFSPTLDTEWLPLVDAYLHLQNYEKATEVTQRIVNRESTVVASYCKLWKTASNNQNVLPYFEETISWLNCEEVYEQE